MKTEIVKDKKSKQRKLDESGKVKTIQVQAVTEEREKVYTCLHIGSKIRGYEIDLAKYITEMVRASAAMLKTLGINVVNEIKDDWYRCRIKKKKDGEEIIVDLID